MDLDLISLAIAAVSVAVFGLAYAAALLATRPSRPAPAPATPELGEEPPAVVHLLTNRWRLGDDAAESTLLDLAARRVIELRQPGDDPTHTTIHMRRTDPGQLRPYEQRVLDRIRGLAVDGVIPVTALTFRNPRQARTWTHRLHREVVAEARVRGLSRRRFGGRTVATLLMAATVSAGGVFLAVLHAVLGDPAGDADVGDAAGAGLFAFGVLAGLVGARREERDTPAGRAVAARWLGVRDWLRGHEEFALLPPAAVAVWDRYLPYGAALGVTRTASAVLDLGMGDRRRVWSSYGDRWRRVRVRYPRFGSRYGRTVPSVVLPALATAVLGGLLVRYRDLPAEFGSSLEGSLGATGPTVPAVPDSVALILLVVGVLLMARGGYRVVRALVDLATTRTITGQVLWLELWRTRSGGKNRPRVPWLHYLAVDDGHADRTTAWGLPHAMTPGCRDGDTVRIRVRPWTRRVVELEVVERGRAHGLVDRPVPTDPEDLPMALRQALRQLTGRTAADAGGQPPG